MALPTITDLKAVLRIQTTVEDTLLTALLASAQAQVEAELGRQITAATKTWEDAAEVNRVWGGCTGFPIPVENTPFDTSSLTITDADGATLLDSEDYYAPVTGREGLIRARPGVVFSNPPYTLAVDAGLSALADYSTVAEPVVFQAILDTAADYYQRRSAAATSESTGGGVSSSYAGGLPLRVKDLLSPFKAIRA